MIFEKVRELICDKLSVEASEVAMETSFVDDLGADSLDIVELIMALEDEFDIEVADEEAENMGTVGDAVEYIKEHIQE
ncbi:acyl carrier protein [Clostridium frigidicarnis]|uniref:Acyl carrier protein n=1 Tax=Clostridium frigidicarnis TaxID=84698 RepID=A0A1I0ZRV1_9CLOT|nr:acyl carrier protein [Clostridium frigidicarnis]SFB27170.1 acyl carrier protein [Clostridium frigidicarnis]